jgi:hypothetical protein
MEGHGLILDGWDASPDEARARAAEDLAAAGVDPWLSDTSSADVQRAWLCPTVGFCGERPSAQRVVVVAVVLPPAEAAKVT